MTYREISHIRYPSHLSIDEMALAFNETYCRVGYHLVCIPFYTEIIGLHLAATGTSYSDALPPAQTIARFCLMTRHIQTYLPEYVIPGSDTSLADPPTPYPLQIGNDSTLKINSSAPGGDYTIDFFYPNPIIITQPDYIYIAIIAQSAGGGRFRADFTNGNPYGMTDLEFIHTLPTNANILTWAFPTEIAWTKLEIVEEAILANLSVSLITQQPASNIPYLMPVRLP